MKTDIKRIAIAVAATAAIALGTLVIKETTTPKMHTVYFPIMYCECGTLKTEFAKHGVRFGFAVSSSSFENPTTRAIIEEHASIVVTENALNMKYTQPKLGKFNFSEGDKIVRYARKLGIDVHGHTASWWHANPPWLTDGTFSSAELEYILANHISTLSKHYDGKLASLIAANEGYLSCGVWCEIGMNNYVQTSFGAAGDSTPLIYNSIFTDIQE